MFIFVQKCIFLMANEDVGYKRLTELRMSLIQLFEVGFFEKVEFSKSTYERVLFEKAEYLIKTVKKCFLKKLSV